MKHFGLNKPEPAPNTVEGPAAWDLVIEDAKERDRIGTAKYGQRLTIGDGRNSLIDSYQEVLDLAVYMRKEIEEKKLLLERLAELEKDKARLDFITDCQFDLCLSIHDEWMVIDVDNSRVLYGNTPREAIDYAINQSAQVDGVPK